MTTSLFTRIDPQHYKILQTLTDLTGDNKRIVIEKALENYQLKLTEEKIEQAYEKMAKDKEYLEEMKHNTSYLGTL